MDQALDFFRKLLDTSDWPPRWHCGKWTEFHGWLYIISDLLIWSAYFAIPLVILKYISRKVDSRFVRAYFLFAAFILACGSTHLLDAITFWFPAYRLNALVRLITGIVSWITVFHVVKLLPVALKLKSHQELEREVKERERAEEELRVANVQLTEAQAIAKMGHWQWDVGSGGVTWSKQLYVIYGVTDKGAGLTFEDYMQTIHPEDKQMVQNHLETAFQTGVFPSFLHRIILPDGTVRTIQSKGEVIKDGGKIVKMLGTGQDVTEQTKAQNELLEKTNLLEETNTELQRFAYVASHDLQEPLRKILTFASLLEKEEAVAGADKSAVYLQKISSAATRMQKLIDDILQFSSLKADRNAFEKTDLNTVLANVLSDMEIKIAESGAVIHKDFLPEVDGIPSQLGQLFQNLISNAIKFHKPGVQPVINIRATTILKNVSENNAQPKSSVAEIKVQDNGIGFDEVYKEKVFEIFQRLHNSKTHSGTGIGLAISKKIVDNHQGSITVESQPNVGTTFTIHLPLKHDAY